MDSSGSILYGVKVRQFTLTWGVAVSTVLLYRASCDRYGQNRLRTWGRSVWLSQIDSAQSQSEWKELWLLLVTCQLFLGHVLPQADIEVQPETVDAVPFTTGQFLIIWPNFGLLVTFHHFLPRYAMHMAVLAVVFRLVSVCLSIRHTRVLYPNC